MSTIYPPNPALHSDPEIEKRCPYCHPKPKPLVTCAPDLFVDFNGTVRPRPSAAQTARYEHRLTRGGGCTTGVD